MTDSALRCCSHHDKRSLLELRLSQLRGENQDKFHTSVRADDAPSDRMINIRIHEHTCIHCKDVYLCVCVCVCVCGVPLCALVQTVQAEKAGCRDSKIISLPDGKTSHIPFEVPHVIPCKG